MQRKADPRALQPADIWVLLGHRAGDNAQALAFAAAVGGEVVAKQLSYNALHRLPNVLLGETLVTLSREARGLLCPPWPKLVVAVGKRSAPVARWIRAQAKSETKIVHLGRPRAPLAAFDLVVTTPQYKLPQVENVVEAALPFAMRSALSDELGHWAKVWARLPRPWLMAIVGGQKYPLRLSVDEGRAFGLAVHREAMRVGASVLLFNSPRSDSGVFDAAAKEITGARWTSADGDAMPGAYAAGLALADRFAVTSDSVSMISDVVATGRPVSLFLLPVSAWRFGWRTTAGWGRWLSQRGLLQPPRDTQALVAGLVASGMVNVLGEGFSQGGRRAALAAQHHDAVRRARALMGG